jgi:hypothetical protein
LEKSGATGVVFFLAAARGDRRELAVALMEDTPLDPVHVFADTPARAGFRPRETLFALSETETSLGAEFRTRLLHIETDSHARPKPIAAPSVAYRLHIHKEDGVFSLRYRLTPESVAKLEKRHFHPGYPPEFERGAEGLDPDMLERRMIDPRALGSLPFPPHHAGPLAAIARRSFLTGHAPPPRRLGDGDWDAPARLGSLDPAVETAETATADRRIVIVPALPGNIPPPPGGRMTH